MLNSPLPAQDGCCSERDPKPAFKIGDQVRFTAKCANPQYDYGIGTVTNITPKTVVVRWHNWERSKPQGYLAKKLSVIEESTRTSDPDPQPTSIQMPRSRHTGNGHTGQPPAEG